MIILEKPSPSLQESNDKRICLSISPVPVLSFPKVHHVSMWNQETFNELGFKLKIVTVVTVNTKKHRQAF